MCLVLLCGTGNLYGIIPVASFIQGNVEGLPNPLRMKKQSNKNGPVFNIKGNVGKVETIQGDQTIQNTHYQETNRGSTATSDSFSSDDTPPKAADRWWLVSLLAALAGVILVGGLLIYADWWSFVVNILMGLGAGLVVGILVHRMNPRRAYFRLGQTYTATFFILAWVQLEVSGRVEGDHGYFTFQSVDTATTVVAMGGCVLGALGCFVLDLRWNGKV